MVTIMEFQMKSWLETPFEISAWTAALGVQSLTAGTLTDLIDELAKTLAKFSPAALEVWKAQQEVTLATAAWVTAGTKKRSDAAIARGLETPFGKALAASAVLCDARIICLVGDNARTAPPQEKED